MKIFTFKYDLGDKVFYPDIDRNVVSNFKACEVCEGTGKIRVKDREYCCQEKGCAFNYKENLCGIYSTITAEVATSRQITIGEQKVEINKKNIVEQYMCNETGIGTGSVYNVKYLFETKEEAEACAQDEIDAKEMSRK